jgi:hypothetical protein
MNGTASVNFTLPQFANVLHVYGTVGYRFGTYRVIVDPLPPYASRTTFNATRTYTSLDELLYYTPLDPAVTYTVSISGALENDKTMGLRRFTWCFFDPL